MLSAYLLNVVQTLLIRGRSLSSEYPSVAEGLLCWEPAHGRER